MLSNNKYCCFINIFIILFILINFNCVFAQENNEKNFQEIKELIKKNNNILFEEPKNSIQSNLNLIKSSEVEIKSSVGKVLTAIWINISLLVILISLLIFSGYFLWNKIIKDVKSSAEEAVNNLDVTKISKKLLNDLKNEITKMNVGLKDEILDEVKIKDISYESIKKLIDQLNSVSEKAENYLLIGDHKDLLTEILNKIEPSRGEFKQTNSSAGELNLENNKSINELIEKVNKIDKLVITYEMISKINYNINKSIDDVLILKLIKEISIGNKLEFLKKELEENNIKYNQLSMADMPFYEILKETKENKEFVIEIFESQLLNLKNLENNFKLMKNELKINIFQKFMTRYRTIELKKFMGVEGANELFEGFNEIYVLFNRVYNNMGMSHINLKLESSIKDYESFQSSIEKSVETDLNLIRSFSNDQITAIDQEGFLDANGNTLQRAVVRFKKG